ncbi:MAG: DUF4252 domain-containing protein [Muribaculaceae bacterium]|nr:DUF4252 domain-containing protein [Muribaculaceae bacterium]
MVCRSMKCSVKIIVLFMALSIISIGGAYAQEPSKIEIKVNELVKKYDDVKGVDCMTVKKGLGLNMVKMMFKKQFGKEFMKGVTSITIIDYSDAPQQTCLSLRKEFDAFSSLLQEIKIGEEKDLADIDYIRIFAANKDDNTLSDFIVVSEDNKNKVLMYMAGQIKVKK